MSSYPYIPYFTTSRYRVKTMVELANISPGETVADLGSGDGRILIAMAQQGACAHGFEIDKKLLLVSKNNISNFYKSISNIDSPKITNLPSQIVIHETDFWNEDLSKFDIITMYPMPDIMEDLERKLQFELKPGSRILLNYYPFSKWKYTIQKDKIFLYIK